MNLRCILALVLCFPFVALAADDPPAKLPLEIAWHGQSFFTIKTPKGTSIAIDPHAITQYGRLQGVRADLVLISHNHNDHTQVGVLENAKDGNLHILTGLK